MNLGKVINLPGYQVWFLLFIFLVNPYGLNIYLGYLITVFIVFQKDFFKKNLDNGLLFLFSFSVTYAAFFAINPTSGKQYIFLYALLPSSFYLLGKYVNWKYNSNPHYLFIFLFLIGILFSSTGLLSVLNYILNNGFQDVERNLPNYWSNLTVAATIMGSFFALNMCIPAILLGARNKFGLFFLILGFFFFSISLVCVLRIGSRTQLGIWIFTMIISLLYLFPKQSAKTNVILIGLLLAIIFFIVSNINFDFDQDWLSAFAGRMENNGSEDIASGGGRVERWKKSLEYLFQKPLGWELEKFGHAHNLWLDVLRIGGFIPFILLIIFSIISFRKIKNALRVNANATFLNNQIIIYFVSFFLVFMVEPILEGMFDYFVLFCLLLGVVSSYAKSKTENSHIQHPAI